MNEWQTITKEEKNQLIKLVCTQNLSLSQLVDLVNDLLKGKNYVS